MLEKVDRPYSVGSVSESTLYDVEPSGILDPFPVMHESVLEVGLTLFDIVFGADLLDERRI
jgi:hypothetical protein